MHLLPTPNATHGRPTSRTGPLLDGIDQLLPTPTMRDGSSGPGQVESAEGTPNLRTVVVREHWGRYAAAVARWEAVTGNPVPEPTVPGTKGQPTLNARLSEWVMGLPAGFLDVPGVSASAQKAAAGNGVVVHQELAALSVLLGLGER